MLEKKPVPRVNVLRNQEGTMLQSKNEIKQRWTQYCSSLNKDHGRGEEMLKELEEITLPNNEEPQRLLYSEVEGAVDTLKRNKSPGSDGITAELLQAGWEQLARQMLKLCNKAWEEGAIPEEWDKSMLVSIPKKGDLSDCSNYRTISLINHTGKVLSTGLLARLNSHLDPYLSEKQAKRQGKKVYNYFIDFHKAFSTIKDKIAWCRNKDGHPATKDLWKSSGSCSGRKRERRVVWNRRRGQARQSSVTTPLHRISWSSNGPGKTERLRN